MTEKIKKNLEIQSLLTKLSTYFLTIEDFDAQINYSLQLIGQYLQVSRVNIFENFDNNQKTRCTFEWCDEGIPSQKVHNQDINYKDVTEWKDLLLGDLIVCKSEINDFSENIKKMLERELVKSILVFPIFIKNHFFGFISIDECRKQRTWNENEIEFVKTISNIYSNAYERQKNYTSIKESEEKFRTIFNNSTDLIFITDFNNRFLEVNETAVNKLGYPKEYFSKITPQDISQKHQVNLIDKKIDEVKQSDHLLFGTNLTTQKRKLISIDAKSQIIHYNNKPVIMTIARDTTNEREEKRKHISTIIETEERERQRIAEDLHDGLGPLLSTIKMYINMLKNDKTLSHKRELLDYTSELIDESIGTTRQIAHNVMPNVLQDFGLSESIKEFCEKLNVTKALNINFDLDFNLPIDQNLQVALFRITKELINNTLKHAYAKNVEIILKAIKNNSRLQLQYSDDGIGFDIKKLSKKKSRGIGISNIREKVKSYNGTCRFSSKENKGLTVKINVPLDEFL